MPAQQVYAVNTLGGFMSVPYLSDQIRHRSQPIFKFRQFIDAKEAVGLKRGNTFNFDKISNIQTQGGTLVETSTIPESNYTINQGTAVVTEYGNSIPYTAKLNSLSQFEISPRVEKVLVDDQVKVLESAAGDQFVASELVGVCITTASTDIVTTGTATATATADLTAANHRDFVNDLKRRLVPKYSGNDYVLIGSINLLSGMHADVAAGGWQDISKYTGEFAKNIFNGEVGRFFHTRFVEETGYLSDVVGNGAAHGQGVYVGEDYVYEAMSIAEEIRVKNSSDFGRDLALAWYGLMGFQIVWDFAADGEQHGMFITSA